MKPLAPASPVLPRRSFLAQSSAALAAFAAPAIVPSRVLGARSPGNRIHVGLIGMGRQMTKPNLPQFLALPDVQVVAVCDVDAWRLDEARRAVEAHYGAQAGKDGWRGLHRPPRLPRGARPRRRRRGDDRDARPLARPDRDRGGEGRQARLGREAAHDLGRGGPRAVRRGRPRGRRLAHGQRVPLAAALRARGRARPQRPHREAPHDPHRRPRRHAGHPAAAGHAGPARARLREVARAGARGPVHREARPRPPRPRVAPELDAHLRLRGRDDRELGHPPQRHRPVGERQRDDRAGRGGGRGRVHEGPVEHGPALRGPLPLRERGRARLPLRHAVHPLRGRPRAGSASTTRPR